MRGSGVIGIDPAASKGNAYAFRVGRVWTVGALHGTDDFPQLFKTVFDEGIRLVVLEGGFVGVNPRVALALERVRGEILAYAQGAGLHVHMVAPATWQTACLSMGGTAPKKHAEIAAMSKFRAKAISGMDLDEDAAVAVCLSEWGESNFLELAGNV